MAKAGLNGNYHGDKVFNLEEALNELGVRYLGNEEWKLPEGAYVYEVSEEDFVLVMPDGTEYHVWTEE